MTDVLLSKARDLMRQATDEPWNASIQKTLTEKLQQLASRGGTDSVSDAGSVLHHFKKPENREASFTTHGGWPLTKPCVDDLVQAGFFYAPLPGCEDRVACYSCGKVLFNWDADDEILNAHRMFSPDCPLVTGKVVDEPEEKKDEKPSWIAGAGGAVGGAGEGLSANLTSFVETIRQTANSVDMEELVKRAKSKGGKKTQKTDFPTARLCSDSEQTHSEGDGEGKQLATHEGSRRLGKQGNKRQQQQQQQQEADSQHGGTASRLWRFDWSTPAEKDAGSGGILDAQAGELEMRLAMARKMMVAQKDEWFATGLKVEVACREMEAAFGTSMEAASGRVDALGNRARALTRRVELLRDDAMLAERGEELAAQRSEGEALAKRKEEMEKELTELRVQTAAERADIDLIKDKISRNARLDSELDAKQKVADEADTRAAEGERRLTEATKGMREMKASMVRVRDELRDEISLLHQSKLAEESALGEAQEQMLRTKRLYMEYKDRLGELERRERSCGEREGEMRSREEHVTRRENTLKSRDEWMAKRESEFRIQQRALENNLSIPRMMSMPATASHDSKERGTGGGGGSGGSSAASGSKGVDLAEQVMQAQTDWSIRPNQGMNMATGKGKSGAKEAAQRDYKAILSTADANDPTMEREAAKASRRKEISNSLASMIPGFKKKNKPGKAPAAGFFDMNTI